MGYIYIYIYIYMTTVFVTEISQITVAVQRRPISVNHALREQLF